MIARRINALRNTASADGQGWTSDGWHYTYWQGVTWGAPGDTHCTVDVDDTVRVWVDREEADSDVVPGAYWSALAARPAAVQALIDEMTLDDSPVELLVARDIHVTDCTWSGRVTLADGRVYYLPLSAMVRTWRQFSPIDRTPWAPLPSDGDPLEEAAELFRVGRDMVEVRMGDGYWWGRLRHERAVWLESPGVRVEGPRLPGCWPMDTPQTPGTVRAEWCQGRYCLTEPRMARVSLAPAEPGRYVVVGITGGGTWPWREYGSVAQAVVEAACAQGLLPAPSHG